MKVCTFSLKVLILDLMNEIQKSNLQGELARSAWTSLADLHLKLRSLARDIEYMPKVEAALQVSALCDRLDKQISAISDVVIISVDKN